MVPENINPDTPLGWEHLFRSGMFPPRYQTTAAPNASVVDWAQTLPPAASVLDIGCGVGRHLVYLGERGFHLAGMDIAPAGVEASRQACAERAIPLDARVASMTALPWPESSFDAVLSTATICHLRRGDILKTLTEIRRVLKPGGLLLVDFLHKGTLAYQQVLQQVAAGELVEIEPHTYVDQRPEPDLRDDAFLPHYYCDEADVRDLLIGFEILNLWADLAPSEGGLPKRGYWVASTRKSEAPLSSK